MNNVFVRFFWGRLCESFIFYPALLSTMYLVILTTSISCLTGLPLSPRCSVTYDPILPKCSTYWSLLHIPKPSQLVLFILSST